jgi:hypothetical protein
MAAETLPGGVDSEEDGPAGIRLDDVQHFAGHAMRQLDADRGLVNRSDDCDIRGGKATMSGEKGTIKLNVVASWKEAGKERSGIHGQALLSETAA